MWNLGQVHIRSYSWCFWSRIVLKWMNKTKLISTKKTWLFELSIEASIAGFSKSTHPKSPQKRPVSVRFEPLFVRSCNHTPHFVPYISGDVHVLGGDEERERKERKGSPWWATSYVADRPCASMSLIYSPYLVSMWEFADSLDRGWYKGRVGLPFSFSLLCS